MKTREKRPVPPVVARADHATRIVNGRTIVDHASLEVRRGEIVLLTGHSGSGKSSLHRMIAGIVEPAPGKIEVMGENLALLSDRERDQLKADHVGVGFQKPDPHTNFSVRDNFYGLARARGQEVDFGFAAHVLNTFGLTGKLDQRSGDLSGGETLRLGIGRILVSKPDLLLLDEPTAALDGEAKYQVMQDIAAICHDLGAAALIVTHEVETARPIADREYQMAGGRIVNMLHRADFPTTVAAADHTALGLSA